MKLTLSTFLLVSWAFVTVSAIPLSTPPNLPRQDLEARVPDDMDFDMRDFDPSFEYNERDLEEIYERALASTLEERDDSLNPRFLGLLGMLGRIGATAGRAASSAGRAGRAARAGSKIAKGGSDDKRKNK